MLPAGAFADQVQLKNGDRLTGKITRVQSGMLTIKTELAGTVTIPYENVATFSTDEAVGLRLDDGSILRQKVNVSTEERRIEVLETEVLKGQTISMDRVEAINPRPTQWDGALTVSAEIDTGNTQERTYAVRFEGTRRSKVDRIGFVGQYDGERTKSSGDWVTTKREVEVGLQYDYFFAEKMFTWASTTAEKDGIAELDLRLVAGGGLGYQWVERDDLKFNTQAGMTWVSENYSDATDDDSYIGGRFAFRFDYTILEDVKLFSRADWIPSYEANDDHIIKAAAGVRTHFTKSLFGEARVDWEWDSTPADNAERQDTTYLLGLGWTF